MDVYINGKYVGWTKRHYIRQFLEERGFETDGLDLDAPAENGMVSFDNVRRKDEQARPIE